MSALQPPPLPDVPFARLAPDDAGAAPYTAGTAPTPQGQYYLRPVSWAARFFLFLPLPLVAVLAGLFLVKQYRSGADFTHDKNHVVVWFFDVVLFGIVAGVALLSATVALASTWRRLGTRARLGAGGAGLAAAVVFGGALACSGTAFQSGKARAYSGVNPALLTADCRAMAAALAAPPKPRDRDFVKGGDPSVPAYIRSLRPRYVSLTRDRVEVIMSHDWVSGAYNESFVVPVAALDSDAETYATQKRMTVLSTRPPVFRYPAPE